MESNDLYQELRAKFHQYCLGKSNIVLIATCEYLEGLTKKRSYSERSKVALKYSVSDTAIGIRSKEIMKLLMLENVVQRWTSQCEFCGTIINSNSSSRKRCSKCIRSLASRIYQRWEKTSICIICGEINPLFLLPTGHHIIGRENSTTSIPICANCHELTKPRTRQGFFLFDNWQFPETRFTLDNSKIYIDVQS